MSKFRIEGLSDINNVLGKLPRATAKATLVRFGKKRLEPMRDTAKAGAPKRTGELAEKIVIGTRQRTGRKTRFADKAAVEVYMGPTSDVGEKAVPEEFGSINNPPHGFMRKAWDQHSGELLTDLAKDLGDEVAATARRYAAKQARKGS